MDKIRQADIMLASELVVLARLLTNRHQAENVQARLYEIAETLAKLDNPF